MARRLVIGGARGLYPSVALSVVVLFSLFVGEDVVCGAATGESSLGGALSSLERKVAILTREREESARLLETLRSEVEERRSEAAEGRSRSEEMSAAVRAELDGLRRQLEALREQQISSSTPLSTGNQVRNDRVTMQWLRAAVRELRAEAAEAAAAQRNSSAEARRRDAEVSSGLSLLRSDAASLRRDLEEFRAEAQRSAAALSQMKSELSATRALHQNAAAMCSDTKAELKAVQAEWAQAQKLLHPTATKDSKEEKGLDYETERLEEQKNGDLASTPDRKMRHLRHISKQLEHLRDSDKQLFISQSKLDKQVRRLEKHMKLVLLRQRKRHHSVDSKGSEQQSVESQSNSHSAPLLPLLRELEERVDGLEEAQKATARSSAFNASRQAAALDKLHLSTLQLLESVEAVESKMDRSVPELQREISKLEFGMAQAISTSRVLKEDQETQRESLKSMGNSLSTLQEKAETELGTLGAMQLQLINISSQVESGESNKGLESRVLKLEDSFAEHLILLESDGRNLPEVHHRRRLLDMEQTVNSSDVPSLVERLTRVQDDYIRVINRLPRDCSEVRGPSGLYLVFPLVLGEGDTGTKLHPSLPPLPSPHLVYCDQENHDGGWIVVQRRLDGEVNFNRKWKEYQTGFGSPAGEFWIGNEALHQMTHGDNCTVLRVDMKDIYGRDWHAEYNSFSVASEEDGYRLFASGYHGDAGDALDYQNGMQFSTTDSDRDSSSTDCAASYEGGWWFSHCQHANLNGRYGLGLTWFDGGRNEWIAVAHSVMKVRRRRDGECAEPIEASTTPAPTPTPSTTTSSSTAA